ncbi:hypothetical protein ABLW58_25935, partial [Salmonella enterica]|uniref:hypothetical protein n=1 Tax=Salmonella enterica TaxID=28901 RepID=UPI0032B4ECCD
PAPAPTPSEPQPSAAGSSGGAPPHFFGDNLEQQMAMDANPNSTFVTTAQKGDDGSWSRTTVRYDQGQKPSTPAPEH